MKLLLGIITGFSLYGIFQDALGMDRYIEYCVKNWLPASQTVPIHLIVIVLCLLFYFGANR